MPEDNVLGFRPRKDNNTEIMHGWDFVKIALGEFIEKCNETDHKSFDGLVDITILFAANMLSLSLFFKIKDDKIWDEEANVINNFINNFCDETTKQLGSHIYQKTLELIMNNIEELISKSSYIFKYTGEKINAI